MHIEITKKELIDIISNYCLDYGVLCDSFIVKKYGYIGYDRFSDAKGFQWNYEVLEKLSEEELYNIYQELWKEDNKQVECDTEDFADLFSDRTPDIPTVATLKVKINKPTVLELSNYLEDSPSTFWIDEANEGIFRTNKFQTLEELMDEYSLVNEENPLDYKTDLKRYQRITKENFIEPKEDAWINI